MNEKNLIVFAIGASAGGLDAIKHLLPLLPNGNVCYIYCQHLSPHHKSLLQQILSNETTLKVEPIDDNLPLAAGCFYVPVPGKEILIKNDCFVLKSKTQGIGPSPNINKLLISVANAKGKNANAIILSGSGNDGASGILEIKRNGGLVLAQDPENSEYDSMPKAAIATHQVDFIGDSTSIGRCVKRILEGETLYLDEEGDDDKESIEKIIKHVAKVTSVDFSRYRSASIKRRLFRRMNMLQLTTFDDYWHYLSSNEHESMQLVQNIFVVVSEFYRDKTAFDSLKKHLTNIVQNKLVDDEVRIWVPGCATGEEAYSITMILHEISEESGINLPLKILATDLSTTAIADARQAIYEADKLTKLPRTWLKKFFSEKAGGFQVRQFIRDKVVFSIHDVLNDTPFSRLDLISCRNMMIYLNEKTQKDVFHTAAYGLRENGILFLGSAETCQHNQLFDTLDEKSKIYIRNDIPISKLLLSSNKTLVDTSIIKRKKDDLKDERTQFYKSLADAFLPPMVIVNSDNDVIFQGGNHELLINVQSGFIDKNIFSQIHERFRPDVRVLLFRARQQEKLVQGGIYNFENQGTEISIKLSVKPLNHSNNDLLIVYCEELFSGDKRHNEDHDLILEIDKELSETRENLQVVIEELESTNEQLQVYNEELQSTNEEYQSTNEELQTVNEELQSSNEELITVNEEHANQTALYQRINSDLDNLQESMTLPFILVNNEYRIKRFNKQCEQIIDISKIKYNDLIFALEWHWEIQPLKTLIEEVVRSKNPVKKELKIIERYYDCQISSYINGSDELDGFVILFYETTQFKHAQKSLHQQRTVAQKTLQTVMDSVIRINDQLKIEFANRMSAEVTGSPPDKLVGRDVTQVLDLFLNGKEYPLSKHLNASISNRISFNTTNEPIMLKSLCGQDRFIELSFTPINKEDDEDVMGGVIAFRDITQHRKQMDSLLWASTHDSLTGLVNRKELEKRLDNCIMSAKRNGVVSSFLYLDLDQFKVINDTCGHQAGDRLLQQLSSMMSEMIRSRDTLGRLGGDEFGLILDKCPIVEAEDVARKLLASVNDFRFSWEDKVFRVGVSIGIVEINSSTNQVAELLSQADATCYLSKESGRNTVHVHTTTNEELQEKKSQMQSVSDINDAIDRKRFLLYFQQVKSLCPKHKDSWEVLVRMHNRKGEFLLPGAFLPAAERFGLVDKIDLWVLENTLVKLTEFVNLNQYAFPKLNLNISGATIGNETYLNKLGSLINDLDIPPRNICIELTESAAATFYTNVKPFIEKVRALGCRFALDDFGRGMSSLSFLRTLSIDSVKIDKTFTKNIATDSVDNAIVKSVKEVSSLLKLTVVAEGIETEAQREEVEKMGLDFIQGYLLQKPVPFEQFTSLAFDNKVKIVQAMK